MRSALGLVLIGVAVVVLIILSSATFVVLQTEQALVLRFGEPVAGRGLITEPGLHFKIPFVETVVLLDNRILDLESPKQEVLASDNQRIEVDAFVRYRIVDPLRFYQTVGTIERANNQLASVLNSAVRRVVVLRASAQQQADQIRGQGDAERNRIFAEAYGQDPDFFAFYRSMQAYDASFKARDTRFVTAPTSDFFRYFGSATGRAAPAAAPPGGATSGGASAQR